MTTRILIILGWTICLLAKPSLAETRVDFNGQIDFSRQELTLALNLSPSTSALSADKEATPRAISAKINKVNDTQYHMSLKLDHFKSLSHDLSTQLDTSLDVKKIPDGVDQFIYGKLSTQYTLIDFKPIRDLSGEFQIKDKKIFLNFVTIGNVTCEGTIDLTSPLKLDLSFHLNDIEMHDFLDFWAADNDYSSSGKVSGTIKASGTPDKILLKGNLQSFNGFVEHLEYDSFLLNAEGYFPKLDLAKTTVTETSGVVFTLDGPIDLSDHENFKKQIKALTVSPVVNDSNQERSWTIKRSQEEKATSEIRYLMRKDGLNPSTSQPSDMMGVEHTVAF